MTVEIVKNDDIWTIIHNRPEARNAINPASADALVEAFSEFDESNAKVGVFYGKGGAFCSGWDLKFASTLNEQDPLKANPYQYAMMARNYLKEKAGV